MLCGSGHPSGNCSELSSDRRFQQCYWNGIGCSWKCMSWSLRHRQKYCFLCVANAYHIFLYKSGTSMLCDVFSGSQHLIQAECTTPLGYIYTYCSYAQLNQIIMRSNLLYSVYPGTIVYTITCLLCNLYESYR